MRRNAFLLFMSLAGCVMVTAAPPAAQSQDREAECAAMTAEIQAIRIKLSELERGGFLERNSDYVAAATGGVGAIVLLGYYGLVEKPSKDKEISTVRERQQQLVTLFEQRCAASAAPEARKRPKRH